MGFKNEFLEEQLNAAGFFQYGVVDTMDINFSQEVRAMCEVNTCREHGKTWACPPAVGTVDECKKRIRQYEKMLIFSVKYDLEDSFDFEGMMEGAKQFKKACRAFDKAIKPYLEHYLILSNEGCDLCKECTYPDAPCRFPDRVHGSLEGNGIFVNEIAKLAKVKYNNGANTVTYFGALVCNEKDLKELENLEVK